MFVRGQLRLVRPGISILVGDGPMENGQSRGAAIELIEFW